VINLEILSAVTTHTLSLFLANAQFIYSNELNENEPLDTIWDISLGSRGGSYKKEKRKRGKSGQISLAPWLNQ
jgi:hypothetical protein